MKTHVTVQLTSAVGQLAIYAASASTKPRVLSDCSGNLPAVVALQQQVTMASNILLCSSFATSGIQTASSGPQSTINVPETPYAGSNIYNNTPPDGADGVTGGATFTGKGADPTYTADIKTDYQALGIWVKIKAIKGNNPNSTGSDIYLQIWSSPTSTTDFTTKALVSGDPNAWATLKFSERILDNFSYKVDIDHGGLVLQNCIIAASTSESNFVNANVANVTMNVEAESIYPQPV